jgi:Tol biopolymer transport system component
MNADGSGLARITHTPWAEQGPAWSPRSNHLAFASYPNGNFDVYIYDLADVLRPGAHNSR